MREERKVEVGDKARDCELKRMNTGTLGRSKAKEWAEHEKNKRRPIQRKNGDKKWGNGRKIREKGRMTGKCGGK